MGASHLGFPSPLTPSGLLPVPTTYSDLPSLIFGSLLLPATKSLLSTTNKILCIFHSHSKWHILCIAFPELSLSPVPTLLREPALAFLPYSPLRASPLQHSIILLPY